MVFALLTPATFALLLYTVGAPHTHGGWPHEVHVVAHRSGALCAGCTGVHRRRAVHPRRL